MNPREKIKQLKAQLLADIQSNAPKYKRSIVKKLYTLLQNFNGSNTQEFIDDYLRRFQLTAEQKSLIIGDLNQTQLNISAVWDSYFNRLDKFQPADYNKLVAAFSVNFNDVEDKIKAQVEAEIKRSVRADYDSRVILKRLQNTTIGFSTAATLVNTGIAQFDNAYQIETAQQSGVEFFLYDGILSKNSRSFCVEHIGRVYTLAELKEMDNHHGIPVDTSLGGYNCQHYLTALINYIRKAVGEKYNPSHHKLVA